MKRIIKISLSIMLCFAVLLSLLSFTASAASTIISFSKNSLSVGETLTVTITINSDSELYGVSCIVNYDSSVLRYDSGNAAGGAGSLKIVESPSGDKRVSYSLKFSALKAGSSAVSVTNCTGSIVGANGAESIGLNGASATVTVKDAALSANANLKSLTLSKGSLSPAFSASRTNYTVTVDNSVTECKVYATAADSSAKVELSGSNALKLGLNTRTVTVTAPDGTQKVYTIKITRKEAATDSSQTDTSSEDETTSSEETPSTPENPLSTNIDGTDYIVMADISAVKLFNGFTAEKIEFNGTEITVAIDADNNFRIYYLSPAEGTAPVPYTYDEQENIFTKLQYYTQGNTTYIFTAIPEDMTVADGYYKTSATINGFSIDCYASSDSKLSDFYYAYCFTDGRFGMYRYDSREDVLQRYPEFALTSISDVSGEDADNDSFAARFNSLSSNAKVIIIGLALLAIGAIALIVLLIVKLTRKNGNYDTENMNIGDEFDSFSVVNESDADINDEPDEDEE